MRLGPMISRKLGDDYQLYRLVLLRLRLGAALSNWRIERHRSYPGIWNSSFQNWFHANKEVGHEVRDN